MPSADAPFFAAALGTELTENQASLRIFLTAGGLALLGCALLLFTIWWWRGTRPESPALGPLEVMSDRRWATASDSERRRLVETNRPNAEDRADEAPVPIDLSVLARDKPSDFDDLRGELSQWPYLQDPDDQSIPSADGSVLGIASATDDEVSAADPSEPMPSVPVEVQPELEVESDEVEPAALEVDAVEPATADSGELLVPNSTDDTMYEVEAPDGAVLLDHELDHFDQHDDQHDEVDVHDEPSEEMVIDPLLQRTASQE